MINLFAAISFCNQAVFYINLLRDKLNDWLATRNGHDNEAFMFWQNILPQKWKSANSIGNLEIALLHNVIRFWLLFCNVPFMLSKWNKKHLLCNTGEPDSHWCHMSHPGRSAVDDRGPMEGGPQCFDEVTSCVRGRQSESNQFGALWSQGTN